MKIFYKFKIWTLLALLNLYSCVSTEKLALEVAKQLNQEKTYEDLINKTSSRQYGEELLELKEAAAYEKAIETNTEKALDDFLNQYPLSPYSEDVVRAKERLSVTIAFENAKKTDTSESYTAFISRFPNSNLSRDAEKLLYKKKLDKNPKLGEVLGSGESVGGIIDETEKEAEEIRTNDILINDSFTKKENNLTENPIDNQQELLTDIPQQPESKIPKFRFKEAYTAQAPLKKPQTQFIPSQQPLSLQKPKNLIKNSPEPEKKPKEDPKDDYYNYLIQTTPYQLKDTPNKVLYGKAFRSNNSPRLIQESFSLSIESLQRTPKHIVIKANFQNLKKNNQHFSFSRINLVNNIGKRVKPVNVAGTNWQQTSTGAVQSNALPNENSIFIMTFPSLNLFTKDNYKLYVTINRKNYLIQI